MIQVLMVMNRQSTGQIGGLAAIVYS